MQAHGAVRGAVTTIRPPPTRRGRRNVLVAIVALVAIAAAAVALMVRAASLATSSAPRAGYAAPGAGSAVVHDDAGNLHAST